MLIFTYAVLFAEQLVYLKRLPHNLIKKILKVSASVMETKYEL